MSDSETDLRAGLCMVNDEMFLKPAEDGFGAGVRLAEAVPRDMAPAAHRLHPVKPRSACRSGDQKSAGRSRPYQ